MRLLHTSDWHLGQTFHDFDRTYEHDCFLDWLLDTLVAEQIEVLLIAGDVFDNANPSAAAQRQLYRFLTAARQRVPYLSTVLIAGNHDSAGRLEAPSSLFALFDAACVGQVGRHPDGTVDFDSLVLPLKNRLGETAAWCLAVPFLRPADLPRVDGAADPYLEGVSRLMRQAFETAAARREPGQPIIALGHCHLRDARVSEDSERRIDVGGAQTLPAAIFDASIAYAALGHLHYAQAVGKQTHLRYSGSPLPMSFNEMHYPHQVVRVDLADGAVAEIRSINVPRAVDLLRVPAAPAPVEAVIAALQALELPELPLHQQPFLQVRVKVDAPEPGLRARVEAALAGKPARLVKIELTSSRADDTGGATARLSVDELGRLDPATVFAGLYRQRYDADAPPALAAAFAEIVEASAGRDA